jgi:hypothetical protein
MNYENYWLIKTEHGYILEDFDGNLIKFFDMACNSKAYCMEQGIEPFYLSQKSRSMICKAYTIATDKTLWWETQ